MFPSVKDRPWSYVLAEPTKILVVDDDPILREFASVYLSSPAAQVEAAAGVDAAIAQLQAQSFDIVLIDIEMPGRDGYELLKLLRQDPRTTNLPIMMLTGREDIASIDLSYEFGATAFTTKPVNWRQLSYQIRYLLRSSRTEETLRRQLAGQEAAVQEAAGQELAVQHNACPR